MRNTIIKFISLYLMAGVGLTTIVMILLAQTTLDPLRVLMFFANDIITGAISTLVLLTITSMSLGFASVLYLIFNKR